MDMDKLSKLTQEAAQRRAAQGRAEDASQVRRFQNKLTGDVEYQQWRLERESPRRETLDMAQTAYYLLNFSGRTGSTREWVHESPQYKTGLFGNKKLQGRIVKSALVGWTVMSSDKDALVIPERTLLTPEAEEKLTIPGYGASPLAVAVHKEGVVARSDEEFEEYLKMMERGGRKFNPADHAAKGYVITPVGLDNIGTIDSYIRDLKAGKIINRPKTISQSIFGDVRVFIGPEERTDDMMQRAIAELLAENNIEL